MDQIKKVQTVRRKALFSTIELILAISVLAVGMTSVIALFPAGLDETEQAVGKNYSAMAARTMQTFITRQSKDTKNNEDGWKKFPSANSKNAKFNKNQILTEDKFNDILNKKPPAYNQYGNIYEIERPSSKPSMLYVVKIKSENSSIPDYQAQILIHYEEVSDSLTGVMRGDFDIDEQGKKNHSKYSDVIIITMKISYPLAKPYESRFIDVYSFEIFLSKWKDELNVQKEKNLDDPWIYIDGELQNWKAQIPTP